MRANAMLAILAMAVVTYATRAGGVWLMSRLPSCRQVEAGLRHLPGALLVSLVTPIVLTGGPPTILAGAAAAFVALRTGRLMPALLAGVVLVVLLRTVV